MNRKSKNFKRDFEWSKISELNYIDGLGTWSNYRYTKYTDMSTADKYRDWLEVNQNRGDRWAEQVRQELRKRLKLDT